MTKVIYVHQVYRTQLARDVVSTVPDDMQWRDLRSSLESSGVVVMPSPFVRGNVPETFLIKAPKGHPLLREAGDWLSDFQQGEASFHCVAGEWYEEEVEVPEGGEDSIVVNFPTGKGDQIRRDLREGMPHWGMWGEVRVQVTAGRRRGS